MEKYQFKTNINCSGCVEKVTPHLDNAKGVRHWAVDTDNAAKILTVETDVLSQADIKNIVTRAGFSIETVAK
jgi:copper chaperone